MYFGPTNAIDWVRKVVDVPLPWKLAICLFLVAMTTISNGDLGDCSIS